MKVLFLFMLFQCITNLPAQDYPTYRLYTLDEFAREHVGDLETFIGQYQRGYRYPAIARENKLEGKFDVLFLNHSDSAFEIIVNTHFQVFRENIYETISLLRKNWINIHIPFMVQFCIEYRLEYFMKGHKPEFDAECDIKISGSPIFQKRDTSDIFDASEITSFPKITSYPSFIIQKRQLRTYSFDIESLLEAAIKSCCNKNINLTHTLPCHHCEYSRLPKGWISVILHSKGYISKIYLQDQLKERVNEDALLKTLQGFRFIPAQFKSIPVHLVLTFIME